MSGSQRFTQPLSSKVCSPAKQALPFQPTNTVTGALTKPRKQKTIFYKGVHGPIRVRLYLSLHD